MKINGVININKEKGLTSFDVVRKVKKITGAGKAGHTGTLDPLATGVLVVCLGKATRLSEYLMGSDKTYQVKMFLGFSTDTYDLEGRITDTADTGFPGETEFRNVLQQFVGNIEQLPPMYSAVKVAGRKLYEYARKGEEVEIGPRNIFIESIQKIKYERGSYKGKIISEASFEVKCSKGTYIRSLCFDIGEKLGIPAVMSDLVRTANGIFGIGESHSIGDVAKAVESGTLNDLLTDPFEALDMETIHLDKNETHDYMNGRIFNVQGFDAGEYLIEIDDDIIVGIGSVDKDGALKSRKRLI